MVSDERQYRQHHQGQFPVHPQQCAEQEDDRHTLTNHDLDRVRGGAGDHGHVEGNARDQMPGVAVVEKAVGQREQFVEQHDTQVMHQPEGDAGQEEVTQIRTRTLPGRDQYDHQRHRLQQLQVADIRVAGEQAGFGIGQAVDEVFENVGEHRLGGCKDKKADNAQAEKANVRPHIGQ
jgi:hypothetical protein